MTTQEWCDLIADTIDQESRKIDALCLSDAGDDAARDALHDLAHSLADQIGLRAGDSQFWNFNRSLFLARCGAL